MELGPRRRKTWDLLKEFQDLLDWITEDCWWGDVTDEVIAEHLSISPKRKEAIIFSTAKDTTTGFIRFAMANQKAKDLWLTKGGDYYSYPEITCELGWNTALQCVQRIAGSHNNLVHRPKSVKIDKRVFSLHTIVSDMHMLMKQSWFYGEIFPEASCRERWINYTGGKDMRHVEEVLHKEHWRLATVMYENHYWGHLFTIHVKNQLNPFVVTFTSFGYTVYYKTPSTVRNCTPMKVASMTDLLKYFKLAPDNAMLPNLQHLVRESVLRNPTEINSGDALKQLPDFIEDWIMDYQQQKYF